MATFTLKTRAVGDLDFYVNDEGGYIRLYGNGWQGVQPCYKGGLRGITLRADASTLEKTARAWWKAFRKNAGL